MSLKREIAAALAGQTEGLSEAELLRLLGLPKHLKRKVLADLQALVEAGTVVKNARHRYRAAAYAKEGAKAAGKLEARFILTGSGHAFARLDDGSEFYIPERYRGWALPDDRVELKALPPQRSSGFGGGRRGGGKPMDDGRKPGAEVVRVLQRGRQQWVGRLRREGGSATCDVRLGELELELEAKGVPDGLPLDDWIVVSAPGLDADGKEPSASEFISHLGGTDTAHLDTLILIKKAGLKEDFDPATEREAAALDAEPGEADKRAEGREDLRGLTLFTIDGADAKDFDDAVSLERDADGWELGVHIADVAHYVRPGSALDKEAYERGTSVYLPDRVLPMLPEALSNGLCSLKPSVDRLAMSALIRLDAQGRITGARFCNSVIHSRRRFTYEDLEDWFEGRAPLRPGEDKALGPTLQSMRQLTQLRRKLRQERGALDFDFPETKVKLDAQGMPIALERRARLFSHQLVEEFMLAANEAVARELREAGFSVLYRVHEEPDPDKLNETLAYLGKLGSASRPGTDHRAGPMPNPAAVKGGGRGGLKLGAPKGGSATPKDLQRLMAKAAGLPQQRLVHTLILRSLRLARYSPSHDIHFGLALEDYCHFTSPIRRYPDLVVHRMLKARIAGLSPAAATAKAGISFAEAGEHTSTMERKAEACERDCVKAKQVRYLATKLGQAFEAVVTSVTHFGFFCEIVPFPAEGLVPVGSLRDDYYDFDAANYCLTGARKKRKISIGDKLWVRVKRTDWEALQVDFEALWEEPALD
jgi:ribonuclease R